LLLVRVLLLNPPVPAGCKTNRDLMGGMGIDDGFGRGVAQQFVATLKNEGTQLPVQSLASMAATLAEHEVAVLDQARATPDDARAIDAAVATGPDWIIASTSFAFLGSELRYLEQLRARTGAKRMLVGATAVFFADEILRRGLAEAIVEGDPEIAAGHLSRSGLDDLDAVLPGIHRLRGPGGPRVGGPGWVTALDALPFNDWSRFDLQQYSYYPLLPRRPFATMLSSRGCPYRCHFCPYPIAQGAPWRPRSAQNVVDEMTTLVEVHGVRSILFRDPTFSMDMDRVRAIARGVIARRLPIEWGIETRLDRMDEPMIDELAEAGCRSAEFGVDPIDEHTRAASKRKGIAPERAAALISAMERAGIATAGLFVIGLPEQDEGELHRTLDWIATLDMSYVNYELATPFPGTELHERAIARGWATPITLDDLLAGDPKLGFNGVIDLEKMRDLQDEALRRFYLSPGRIMRELRSTNLVEGARVFSRSVLRTVRERLLS